MDIIKDSITDANLNVAINNVKNAKYYFGKAEVLIPEWLNANWYADALIVDPPRTGLDITLINTILKMKPKKFVYISCNPSTLSRDLTKLATKYTVNYIQPIDMFPQTARWEGIVKLTLK